jgi:hypothetical protein
MRELGSTLLLAERHYKPSGLTEEDKEKERVAAERGLRQAAPPVGNEEPCDIIGPIESKVRGVWRWSRAVLLCVSLAPDCCAFFPTPSLAKSEEQVLWPRGC